MNARSVIHDSGRIFDHIRERNFQQLEDAARKVTESLRKTLDVLPSDRHVKQAVSMLFNKTIFINYILEHKFGGLTEWLN